VNVDELLSEARAGLERVTPAQSRAALDAGAILVDIRPSEQRNRDGEIPGAHVIARNVLEWRLDPGGEHRDRRAARADRQMIVFCDAGYASSLAAATLRQLGLEATDMIGGFQAWRKEGLPVKEAAGTLRGGKAEAEGFAAGEAATEERLPG
jgi:rhodanese-related sulfurtransferase